MSQKRPTKKQKEMLAFIENFIDGNGYGPSYREIMRGLGYKSVSTVANHVDNLITKGHLRKKDNSARSLEIVGRSSESSSASEIKVTESVPTTSTGDLLKMIDELFIATEHKDVRSQEDLQKLATVVRALEYLDHPKAGKYKARFVMLASPGSG